MTGNSASGDRVHAPLADGTTVCVRAAGPGDHDDVLRLYTEMSDANLRLRFFAVSRRSAEQAAARVAKPADSGYHALVAEHGGRVIGIAEYESPTAGGDAAEIARRLPGCSPTVRSAACRWSTTTSGSSE